jgi:hypothetical protein
VGAPAGTVSFLDGTTPLGQGTLSAGVATLATSSLSDGSHSITAVYNGNSNFVAVTSAPLSQTIDDFNLTPGSGSGGGSGGGGSGGGSGSTTTQTTQPGGTATYPLNIEPNNGVTFPTPVVLTVTGMPAGATAAITPASWTQVTPTSWTFPANTTLPAVTLTIQLPSAVARVNSGKVPPMVWGVLLLPFALRLRATRRRLRGIALTLLLTAASLGALIGLNGCVSGNGFFGQQQSTYTVTVTATSGPLTRSTKLTLNVD